MHPFKKLIYETRINRNLPLLNFYYEGIWETGDTIHQPEINSWVDYLDEFGIQNRFMIGAIENGCQLVQASSIVDFNGCSTCVPVITPPPGPEDFTYYQTEYYDCVDLQCSLTSTPLWIYNLSPNLNINKFYFFNDNRSYKVLSAPYTYAQYVAAGTPVAKETGFSMEYDVCTCLEIAPE